METQLKDNVKLSWGTPVLLVKPGDAEAVDSALRTAITDQSGDLPSSGVWQSDSDVLQWHIPEAQHVQSWIIGAFQRVQERACEGAAYEGRLNIRCWANIAQPGRSSAPTRHAHSAWTFLYCLTGEGETSADDVHIVMQDPRAGTAPSPDPFALFGQPRKVTFEPGQLVLFPSWLIHTVDAVAARHPCFFLSGALATLDLM